MSKFEYKKITGIKFERSVIGAVGGLVGGFAIFMLIFIIDSQFGMVPGTFYKVVGIPVGLEGTWATLFGMTAHILTATLIGAVFYFCSGLHKKLELTSYHKGAFAGAVSAGAVYLIFFVPISLFVIEPALEFYSYGDEGLISSITNIDSLQLAQNLDLIIWGAIGIHLVYGMILGLFCSIVNEIKSRNGQYVKLLKTVTIGILIATLGIVVYYSTIQNVSLAEPKDTLAVELNKIDSELTYRSFSTMSVNEQKRLVSTMPSSTADLILEESKKYNRQFFEDTSSITEQLESVDDLKYLQTTQFESIKGLNAKGKVMVISTGEKSFLRFEGFSVTNGPSLFVYLTKAGDVNSGYEIGLLKANQGNFHYEITGIDSHEYNTVVIYSKPFEMYYASANLPVRN